MSAFQRTGSHALKALESQGHLNALGSEVLSFRFSTLVSGFRVLVSDFLGGFEGLGSLGFKCLGLNFVFLFSLNHCRC